MVDITINLGKAHRMIFGVFRWRERLAVVLFRLIRIILPQVHFEVEIRLGDGVRDEIREAVEKAKWM